MKKILKNYDYMSAIGALFISLIALITFFFIKNTTYFSIAFSVIVLLSFIVAGFVFLNKKNNDNKLSIVGSYLLINLCFLCLDLMIISKTWNMNIYSNVMYVNNLKIYLFIYTIYVLAVALIAIHSALKNYLLKDRNSTNDDKSVNNN